MANDLNEEEAMVISATTGLQQACLGTIIINTWTMKLGFPKIPCQPYVNRDVDQKNYINSILYCRNTHCPNQIRMRPNPFFKLDEMLERRPLQVNMKHMSLFSRSYILKLYPDLLHPPSSSTASKILNNARFYPWFEDCTRALNGTADTISKKFNVKCLPDQVDNHLRTVKTTWDIIAKL
ncbi:hypothetical protein Cgig2_005409 [Carnegiea gigantea]|uniref:Uncharacterized protein n=1 Tax=Carnegiea gigantea TaxID=171969 RepID=A0A9Q1Q646_9CARY|nr:hypothetical protein Cgig2_005409 [Carnegiea gigantea]